MTDNNALAQEREELAKAVAELFAKRPWLSMAHDTDKRVLMKSHGIIPPVTDDELTIEGAFEAADYLLKRIRTPAPAPAGEVETVFVSEEKLDELKSLGLVHCDGGEAGLLVGKRNVRYVSERLAGPVQCTCHKIPMDEVPCPPCAEKMGEQEDEYRRSVQQAGQRPPALGGGMLKRIKDMSQQAGGDQIPRLPRDKLLYGSPDYIDDPEAFDFACKIARAALAAMQPAPLDGEG